MRKPDILTGQIFIGTTVFAHLWLMISLISEIFLKKAVSQKIINQSETLSVPEMASIFEYLQGLRSWLDF